MTNLLRALYADEAGFIVSAELVLVVTVGVIAMVVGLAEVSFNVSKELEDAGSAVSKMNQGYHVAGTHGHKACTFGSSFYDKADFCDGECDISCDNGHMRSEGKYSYGSTY